MFGFSAGEILIIGIVALIFIGPNDLPRAMKTAARWMSAGRKLAREFQGHVDELVREAELEELRDQARKLSTLSLSSHIESIIDPNREIAEALTPPELYGGTSDPVAKTPQAEIAAPSPEPELPLGPELPPAVEQSAPKAAESVTHGG